MNARAILTPLGATVLAAAFAAGATAAAATAGADVARFVAGGPAAEHVTAIAAMLPAAPGGIGPTYRDREAWGRVLSSRAAEILRSAEGFVAQPIPAWDDEAYLEFSRHGTRHGGEAMMAARFKRLPTLALAECLENRGRFVAPIEAALLEWCRQPSWTLPAHDRQLTNFHRSRYEVDLNVATTGLSVAQLVYMLDDKLAASVRAELLRTFRERMFGPVAASLRTGEHHEWLTVKSNWNAVCLSGVTGAALTLLPRREERALFVAAAEHYSRNYISSFNDDGFCTEGLGYFNYGFGYFLLLRESVSQATHGAIDLFADPKLQRILRFPAELEMNPGVWPAIADCRFGVTPAPALMAYFGQALGVDVRSPGPPLSLPGPSLAQDCLWLFPNAATRRTSSVGSNSGRSPRSYFEKTGVLVCRAGRPDGLSVALKGGHNAGFETHNHNDLGSFSIGVGGQLLLGDPGGPHEYTSETFGPRRYELYKSLASFGHPVPLVAGREQRHGVEAVAQVVQAEFTPTEDRFSLDLTSAYPVPGLKTLIRHFTYDRTGSGVLLVRDEFAFAEPATFEVALCTHYTWRQTGPRSFEFTNAGERLLAEVLAPAGEIEVTPTQIEENAPKYTRIGLRLAQPVAAGELTMRFSPAPR
jgi:hypothetical protein